MIRWNRLLADPGRGAHVAQLYQDDEFLAEAVAHFAAEGFARGESVILVPTKIHWTLIAKRLAGRNFDPENLTRQGRLTVLDLTETRPHFMRGNMPDAGVFKSLAKATIDKARAEGQAPRVRWWGEIVNDLYMAGNLAACIRLEELCTELAREEKVAIFCSFRMDAFDPRIYDGPLQGICRTHAHLIPVRHDDRHRVSVDRAFAEVFGPPNVREVEPLVARSRWADLGMPFSQALLLWLKEYFPDQTPRFLASVRQHYERATQPKQAPG